MWSIVFHTIRWQHRSIMLPVRVGFLIKWSHYCNSWLAQERMPVKLLNMGETEGYWKEEMFVKQASLLCLLPKWVSSSVFNWQLSRTLSILSGCISDQLNECRLWWKQAWMHNAWFICKNAQITQIICCTADHPIHPGRPKGIKAGLT